MGSRLLKRILTVTYRCLATILWSVALTAIFAPFALRAYARRTGG